jgi:alpha-methylacyl-CoA racemase
VARLADADTCVAPVLDIAEVVADAQFAARGAFVEAKHPRWGTVRQLGPLLAGAPRRPLYELRETTATDTAELLAAAGFTAGEVEALTSDGVIA